MRECLHAPARERERPARDRAGRGRGPQALEPCDRRRDGVRIRLVDPHVVHGIRHGSGRRDRDLGSERRVASRIAGRGARPAVRRHELEHDAVRGRRLARPPGAGVREELETQAVVRAEVERHRRSGGMDARARPERVPQVGEPPGEAPEKREALGGSEEKPPALAHAVEEMSRRLPDDGREDPAVQHEARVRGKALALRQVERLVEPAAAPVGPEEAELEPGVAVAGVAEGSQPGRLRREAHGIAGRDAAERGEIRRERLTPRAERRARDPLDQRGERRHPPWIGREVGLVPAEPAVREPDEERGLVGRQRRGIALELGAQLMELGQRARGVGQLRRGEPGLDRDDDLARDGAHECKDHAKASLGRPAEVASPGGDVAQEPRATALLEAGREIGAVAERLQLPRQRAAGGDHLRHAPAEDVGVGLLEELVERPRVSALEPSARQHPGERLLALPRALRPEQQVEHAFLGGGRTRGGRSERGVGDETAGDGVRVLAPGLDRARAARLPPVASVLPDDVVRLRPDDGRFDDVVVDVDPLDAAVLGVAPSPIAGGGREVSERCDERAPHRGRPAGNRRLRPASPHRGAECGGVSGRIQVRRA